ncbi:MAG: macrocin O-methyltransferase [bacterium]|nr:macrocin O-methyltransferase [bacterium]
MIQKIIDRFSDSLLAYGIRQLASSIELKVMTYYHDKQTMEIMKQIFNEDKPFLLWPSELLLIYSFAKNQVDIDGDYAEVGVFKGATAKAICEAKRNKSLHLFDTFEGLPQINSKMDNKFATRMFKSDFQRVKDKLAKYPNIHIYKGIFPQTGTAIQNKKFAFVHLDVDIYQSTKDCIEFFYNRMSKNGIIISHDYHVRAVKLAFQEFFKDKPEQVIQLQMSQCMVIKR